MIITNRSSRIIKDFYDKKDDSSEIDVSKEKKRILKAALDVMLEEIRTFDKYSSKTDDYPTTVGQSVDDLLNGNII